VEGEGRGKGRREGGGRGRGRGRERGRAVSRGVPTSIQADSLSPAEPSSLLSAQTLPTPICLLAKAPLILWSRWDHFA